MGNVKRGSIACSTSHKSEKDLEQSLGFLEPFESCSAPHSQAGFARDPREASPGSVYHLLGKTAAKKYETLVVSP